MLIRLERPADFPEIRKIIEEAFQRPDEATLVERLRDDGDAVISAVAVNEGAVVGHVMFSKITAPFPALALAPIAVTPVWQGHGIASALIRWGLDQAKRSGWQAVFVLGDPRFYERFGFDPALARGFASPYAGPHFMTLALNPLPILTGKIDYAPAFAALE